MKNSKKTVSILLATLIILILLPCLAAAAADTPGNGLALTLNSDQMSYSVSGIGTCTDQLIVIPGQYNNLPVTGISDRAFYGCSRLTGVRIPEGVTDIGSEAFYGCYGLSAVDLPESLRSIGSKAFCDCSSLSSITIPAFVSGIGEGAFCGCSSLTGIEVSSENPDYFSYDGVLFSGDMSTLICYPAGSELTSYDIPEGVNRIGDCAFFRCVSLTSITIPGTASSIGSSAFQWCLALRSITIPSGVTRIGDSAFEWCSSLTDFTISGRVTEIGNSVCRWCRSLTSASLPAGVTVIGNSAFDGCIKLSRITIPQSVTDIGGYAFNRCSALTGITLPANVRTIGAQAFSGCTGLTGLSIPANVCSIGTHAFSGCTGVRSIQVAASNPCFCTYDGALYNKEITTLICYPIASTRTSFAIPKGVTGIDDQTFYNCTSLTRITIPEGVTSIGMSAFEGCSSLTVMTLPESVTSIGAYAFFKCSRLSSIYIPEGVTDIGDSAFFSCVRLSGISLPEGLRRIGNYALYNCPSLPTLTIPEGVTSIGMYTFNNCNTMSDIHLPRSLTAIDKYAFYGCSSLTDVYYAGTQTQWNELVKGIGNAQLLNAAIHYSCCIQHDYAEKNNSATCTAAGVVTYTCSYCGESCVEASPALGHHLVTDAALAPTCTEAGLTEGCHCVRDGCDYAAAQETIPALGHSYLEGFCIRCGAEDPETKKQLADPAEAQFALPTVIGITGQTVTVPISIANNPGIVSACLMLYYDTEKLELISAEDTGLLSGFSFHFDTMPCILRWAQADSRENNTANGEIAVLTFRIREDCQPGEADLRLRFDPNNILDVNSAPVPFALTDGSIHVMDYIPGDLDSDGEVTVRDAALLHRYLVDPLTDSINELAADCDGVPGISAADYGYLRRSLAYWEGYALKYPQ